MDPYVLLVDDSFEGAELLRRSLEMEGYSTKVATNGLEALKHLSEHQQHPPQILLLDLYMPVMNGFEFLRRLATQPMWNRLPIYVISGTSQELPQAVTGYFEKPVDVERLIATVEKHWSKDDGELLAEASSHP